jgi:hypothetical protein
VPNISGRVIFADREVAALTALPRGQVYRYMITSGRAIARDARHNVRSRTGKLERSISARITRANATSTRVRISANTDYAEYVHQGTGGSAWSITGDGPGGWMKLYSRPDNPAGAAAAGRIGWYHAWIQEVDGQEPNPFLAQALGEWCMENGFKHPLLRGPSMAF